MALPLCWVQKNAGYQKTASGWRCARGYAGEVRESCVSDQVPWKKLSWPSENLVCVVFFCLGVFFFF